MFAPNVEHLGVVETYRWDDYAYWFTPLAYGDAVSRLTSVKINGPMRLQNITILLMLPTMRLLELTQVTDMRQEYGRTFEWESQDIWENDLNESKSNIEHFHLYDSYVKVSDLKVALRAMRGLKSFVYEHTPNELSIGFLNLDTAAVAELIRSQPHTLDSLHILRKQDVPCIAIQPHILYQTVRALPNLVDLELSHMSWPSSNFKTPEWQDLPAELVCLTLDSINAHCYDGNHDFAHLERNLEALAIRKRRGEFPNLRTLTLARWHPWYGCVPTNVTYIKTMLHDAGIEFITRPAMIGSSSNMSQDIGWVELQTEPEWVIVHKYFIDSG
ncbi:hypothetical protein BU23DRAFT_555215 [Bimuria novae-zelandiae CBS 107.79]|uniref:F-box domain-containing protein n=1 Tax=Bimuria novae-zelandiae CBS 107.79 TaxID=1447943 RepID=A0A6A5V6C9_9PLEO|nr:hypothetical protein BU23DRAFT_555215 [Bimuria novae-zelandiae CBS 107.79]